LCIEELGYMELDAAAPELLFQVLTEREEKASVAIASNDSFGKAHRFPATCARWDRAFTGSGGRAAVPAVAIIWPRCSPVTTPTEVGGSGSRGRGAVVLAGYRSRTA
jgi:IstB-like ATP binding protein